MSLQQAACISRWLDHFYYLKLFALQMSISIDAKAGLHEGDCMLQLCSSTGSIGFFALNMIAKSSKAHQCR